MNTPESAGWTVQEHDLSAANTASYETVYAQANGYRCLRGTSPFVAPAHTGNFIAGLYDQSEAQVTELVNGPDVLGLGVFVDFERVEVTAPGFSGYGRSFDLKTGVATSSAHFLAATGGVLDVNFERWVSHADRRRWSEKWVFTAGFSRRIILTTAIDGAVLSNAHHPVDAVKHFAVTSVALPQLLVACTNDAGLELAETQTLQGSADLTLLKTRQLAERVEAVWALELRAGESATVYRYGVTRTSADLDHPAGESVAQRARTALDAFVADGYEAERQRHVEAHQRLWDQIDVAIDGDDRAQVALRYNLYQLACCAQPDDDRVSIGAKGLHGEGYKGHVFWDTETFMLPFFIFTQPTVAKTLLRYRYQTLAGAKKNALAGGYLGTRFAWESARDGTETTPQWGVDYAGNAVRIWTGDIEVHINADITYAVLKYLQVTGDDGFLRTAGLAVLVGIARFWASFVVHNGKADRFEIPGVIGPDEFHEHVDNNTYTNYLVRWALRKTAALTERFRQDADVSDTELHRWRSIADHLYIPIAPDSALIEQFEGYFALREYPITAWDANGMPQWPDGLDVSKLGETTLLKQPDVVMLFALLGEEFTTAEKIINYEFYEARTMHKSSLSPSMYAMVGLSIGKSAHAYDYFLKAAETDLIDNQGNNSHGIHTANMGGVWQSAVFGFGGLSVGTDDIPQLSPWLPPRWSRLAYRFVWRGNGIRVSIFPTNLTVVAEQDVRLRVAGKLTLFKAGHPTTVDLPKPSSSR